LAARPVSNLPSGERLPLIHHHPLRPCQAGVAAHPRDMSHPFASGAKKVRRFREGVLTRDGWQCRICATLLTDGASHERSAVVDHIRPHRLRPDLTWDEGNCWALCRGCHADMQGIEKRLSPDADAIAAAKLRRRGIGQDGWPVG